MAQKIILNIGVSGAGKSKWSKYYIARNPKTIRINRDDLRRTIRGHLEGYYQQPRPMLNALENMVNKLEEYTLLQAFLSGWDVIIDNTNLKTAYIKKWLEYIHYMTEGEENKPEIWFKIFTEDNAHTLKQRVNLRDAPPSWQSMDYIDKQVEDLPHIIHYIEKNHKNQIINGD